MNVKYFLLIVLASILSISCQSSYSTVTNFSTINLAYDPNNLSYNERIKAYNKIIQSCPIPVIIADQNSLPEKIINSLKETSITIIYGAYISDANDLLWPKEYIFIDKRDSPETRLTTFFHEYQHYKCRITECYCFSNMLSEDEKIIATILKEKHALENELRMSLEMKDTYLIKNSITSIINYILQNDNYTYKIASLCVSVGPYWEKSINFLKEWKEKKTKKTDIILLE